MNKKMIQKVSELATEADEQGHLVLSLLLLHVIRATQLPPRVSRRWVNTESLLLDTFEQLRKTHVD